MKNALALLIAASVANLAVLNSPALAKGLIDTIKLPFQEGRIYRLDLVPGSPFVVELPEGEHAANVWRNAQYWMAETTPGSQRVIIAPIATPDVIGKRDFIHIETAPSNLRISLAVRAVSDERHVPGALMLYTADAHTKESTIKNQVRERLGEEVSLAKRMAEEKAAKELAEWKKRTLENFRDDYEWGGDFRLKRVVDNSLQTWITLEDRGTDKAVIHFIDRSGKVEIVNYELEDGVYVIENKVLRPKEKFRLILGKEEAWIELK
jgi:hypothetical protein